MGTFDVLVWVLKLYICYVLKVGLLKNLLGAYCVRVDGNTYVGAPYGGCAVGGAVHGVLSREAVGGRRACSPSIILPCIQYG